ncbi:hypothetical protein HNO88_002935 [Novosphingobium chloroacetimidivorans]|uniref:Uncharacterized protein n=1 Tax=Novosphingobium chloroacetimidivorans TaxID=1428314 RepID=A0A7W7KBU0_9SPHN|nr:hypothetical protein [Novosphingobium chloroacetimidivorans]MBB4859606.1 hypothetical protein [Novosphingobium chloroacetimidivorans]
MAVSQLPEHNSSLKLQGGTLYSEAAYFDGVPVAHIAAWEERQRLKRIARQHGGRR